jgi:hypothetical protein
MTPFHFILNLSKDKIRPTSCLFSTERRKKSVEAGKRDYREWGPAEGFLLARNSGVNYEHYPCGKTHSIDINSCYFW